MKRILACSLTFLGLLLLLFSLSACSTEAVLPEGGSPDTLYAPAGDSVLLATAPGLHTLSTTDCTVTLNNNTNFGTVTGVASGSYAVDTQISFTISTRPGVEVGTVKINGVVLAAVNGTYTFTVTGDTTIDITYDYDVYTITLVNDDTKGTVTGLSSSQRVVDLSWVSFTITPSENYTLDHVELNGEVLPIRPDNINYGFSVTEDATVEVFYTPKQYAVTVTNDNTKGTLSIASGNYDYGSTVNVTVTPAQHYRIDTVKVNGTTVTATNNQFSFTVTGETSVEVTYRYDAYMITLVNDDAKGTVTGLSSQRYVYLTWISFTIAPSENYTLDHVELNGEVLPIRPDNINYGFSVTGEATVEVFYTPKQYAVTVTNDNTKGTLSITDGNYDYGSTVNVTATTIDGYCIETALVNGVAVPVMNNQFSFTITGATTVEVTYGEAWDLTVTNNSSCTLTAATTGVYLKNSQVTFGVANANYHLIPTVTVNGQVVELLNKGGNHYEYTFTITGDTTVYVVCANYSYRGSDPTQAERRNTVVAAGQALAGTIFQFPDSVSYKHYTLTGYLRGLPYATGGNSLRAFIESCCVDSVGTTVNGHTVYTVDTAMLNATPKWNFVYGASCGDLVYWAWATISNTIQFADAQGMVEANGVYKVGDYTYATTDTAQTPGTLLYYTGLVDTKIDCQNNTLAVMKAAYAQLQPGDAIVWYYSDTQAGHAMLVTEVNVSEGWVKYCDMNGYQRSPSISGLGTVATHSSLPSTSAGDGYFTFDQLYNYGCLPMTCKELLTSQDPVEEFTVRDSKANELSYANLLTGVLESDYYISHVKMQILDADGNVVQSAVRATNEGCGRNGMYDSFKNAWVSITGESYPEKATDVTHRQFYLAQFGSQFNFVWSEQTGENYKVYTLDNTIQTDTLASGTYTCTVTAYDANGTANVVRNFSFTK